MVSSLLEQESEQSSAEAAVEVMTRYLIEQAREDEPAAAVVTCTKEHWQG